MTDVAISEFEEIEPEELHLVGKGANGFKALLAKSASEEVREVLTTIAESVGLDVVKANDDADDKPDCKTCDGSGKIMQGNRKCPKCLGTGVQPKVGMSEKQLAEVAKTVPGSAESGAPVPVRKDCPTCNGSGTLPDNAGIGGNTPTMCPDCDGTGNDAQFPPADKLNAQPGFAGASDDGNGRTTIDKALADYEELIKAKYKQADRDKMADSGQAMSDGAYPIADSEDLDNAIHAVGRGGASHDAIRKHIMARAKALNLASKIPDNWNADGSLDAAKSVETVTKDGVVSGANPFLNGSMSGMDDDTSPAPGSPEWEAQDAQIASDAANAILQAYELTRQFRDREAIEVAAGEGNDVFDAFDASCVLDLLSAAIGSMATLAFHEGIAAQKSAEETAEKSGKRLSGDTLDALVAARNTINDLLGDDDPDNDSDSNDDDDDGDDDSDSDMDDDDCDETTKAILAKEIDDMTGDELIKVLDGRDEKLVTLLADQLAKIAAGKVSADDEKEAVGNAKMANTKNKKKDPKGEMDDLEDEADQGDADSANTSPSGAAKATDDDVELTPEEIEAKTARKEAKKALRAAEEAEKQAAENARTQKAIEEAVAKATEAVKSLEDQLAAANAATEARLATVEKMAAPGGPVKTRTPEMVAKAADRDSVELRIASLERAARETSDPDVRKGNLAIVKELRASLAS